MNKTFSYLVIATMLFVACNKDEQTSDHSFTVVLEATNLNISGNLNTNINVATVKAMLSAIKQDSSNKWYFVYNEIASANFENGGFKLNFPETLPNEYLGSMHELFNIFSYEGITVSDIQSKTGDVWIYAYDNAGNYVGKFKFVSDGWLTEFMYTDRNFTVKGNFQSGSEMDCYYHNGLNIIYHKLWENTSTTQKPLNENFIWILEPPPSPL